MQQKIGDAITKTRGARSVLALNEFLAAWNEIGKSDSMLSVKFFSRPEEHCVFSLRLFNF